MTRSEIRAGFNQIIAAAKSVGDADAVARMEVAREYFTNPEFKKKLEDFVWEQTQGQ